MTTPQDQEQGRSPDELREEVEHELDELTEEAAQEESERLAERDRAGLDEPHET